MRHEFLDAFSRPPRSPVHRLPPAVKLVAACCLIATTAFVPSGFWPISERVAVSWVHVAIALAVLGAALAARLPLRFLLARVVWFAPFPLLLGISAPLASGFDERGWQLMASIVVRALVCYAIVLVLVNTTPFDRLLVAMQRLGVPRLLVATLSFMYRYLFVLWDEYGRIRRAQIARTLTPGGFRWDLAAHTIGMLTLRSFERAERVHAAMLARGYDGTIRSLDDAPETRRCASAVDEPSPRAMAGRQR